jgi:S1-C subfamily serine protease
MKARIFIIAALLAGGFYYATSVARGDWRAFFASRSTTGLPIWSGPEVARSAGLSSDEVNSIDIYKRAHPATVNITSTVYQRNWFMELVPRTGTGSGFLIDDKGHILTNNHVITGGGQGVGKKLTVTLADKSTYTASVLGLDPLNDLALIKIEPRGKLTYLKMGDSDAIQVGQKVLAIGNPFGLDGTLTTGVISSMGRTIQDERGRELEGLLQTDASINQGNSGGPLLDSQGSVIGVNTAILAGPQGMGTTGIGFAMPINKAKTMLDDYQAGRKYSPPRLGVSVVYVVGELAEALGLPQQGGLLVQGVTRGSAAEAAGIRGPRELAIIGNAEIGVGGDLIVALDGKPVDRLDAISRTLSKKRAGDQLEVTLSRGGRNVSLKLTLGAAPAEDRL